MHQSQNVHIQGDLEGVWIYSTSMALHIHHLDITSYGVQAWNFKVWMSCHEEVNKLRVRDDVCRAVAFCYPLHNVGTDVHIHKLKKYIQKHCLLTGTQGLSVHNENK
jgi:hypothetical protein